MIERPDENKMMVPVEVKVGRPAEVPQGARMCPSCGAYGRIDSAGAVTCPHCRIKARP